MESGEEGSVGLRADGMYHLVKELARLRCSGVGGKQLPNNFMNNLERYASEDALVFEGVDFMTVGVMTFFGQ